MAEKDNIEFAKEQTDLLDIDSQIGKGAKNPLQILQYPFAPQYWAWRCFNKSIGVEACNVLERRNGKAIQGRPYADNAMLFQQLGALTLPKATPAG